MWFDLITWGSALCINGDMGTYVFSRNTDMFTFFRCKELQINPCYWHEKLIADSRFEPAKKFSKTRFENIIKGEFRNSCRENRIKIKDRKQVWADIEDNVLIAETEHDAHNFAGSFECENFNFQDFWEHDLTEFSYHFIWCLYAIVWGISVYDNNTKLAQRD